MPVCLLMKKKKERCGFRWKGNVDKRGGGEDLEKVGGREALIRIYCIISNLFKF